jgi:hypothetical protein
MRLAEEVIRTLPIPSSVASAKLTGKWRGASSHCGPDGMSPLKKELAFLHNAANYTLASGALLWSAARLRAMTDVTPLLDIAEALFAFQHDPSWLRMPRRSANRPFVDPDDLPRPVSTVGHFAASVRGDYACNGGHWPAGRMFGFPAECITLTRHNLPKDALKPFDLWTKKVIARLDGIATFDEDDPDLDATKPVQQRKWAAKVMGKPIPPSILDLSCEPNPKTFAAEWKSVLARLDWKKNPYLARPKGVPAARR